MPEVMCAMSGAPMRRGSKGKDSAREGLVELERGAILGEVLGSRDVSSRKPTIVRPGK
jgi:hypothetical protein